jgi:hypothetical protein
LLAIGLVHGVHSILRDEAMLELSKIVGREKGNGAYAQA